MVRDPDIGTDQECFVCDGTGYVDDEEGLSEEKDDLFIKADPESDQLLRFAQQHYPEAGSKQKAFIKFVQRSLKHSKESDQQQDQEIIQLQQQINDIKNAINKGNVSESTDYIEEK
jgi:predicted RNase H-like nuclease